MTDPHDDATGELLETRCCPACNYPLTRHKALPRPGQAVPPMPRAGDLSVCIGCGEALIFGEQLQLELLPAEIRATLEPDVAKGLATTQALVLLARRVAA